MVKSDDEGVVREPLKAKVLPPKPPTLAPAGTYTIYEHEGKQYDVLRKKMVMALQTWAPPASINAGLAWPGPTPATVTVTVAQGNNATVSEMKWNNNPLSLSGTAPAAKTATTAGTTAQNNTLEVTITFSTAAVTYAKTGITRGDGPAQLDVV